MRRSWNPWTMFLAGFFVLACFAFLVSKVHGQTPYHRPLDNSYRYGVPSVMPRISERTGCFCTPSCDCGPNCLCGGFYTYNVNQPKPTTSWPPQVWPNPPGGNGQLPPGIWGPNPPGMGWNPPGSNPTPGTPLWDWWQQNGGNQVSPPIYYPPDGAVSPPIVIPGRPSTQPLPPGWIGSGLLGGVIGGGGSSITVPWNQFPLTIYLAGPGPGTGPKVPPMMPAVGPSQYPYYPNPPASWPPPASVMQRLGR